MSFQFSDLEKSSFLRDLGYEYFKLCLVEYGRSIQMMGSNMIEFFSNLDGLHDYICKSEKFKGQNLPSFRCEYSRNKLTLHLHTERRDLIEFYAGIVQGISRMLFNRDAAVGVNSSDNPNSSHHVLTVDAQEDESVSHCKICTTQEAFSKLPSDNKIGVATFCKTFPFHLIFNSNFQITQMGAAIMKLACLERLGKRQVLLTSLFDIIRPRIHPVLYSGLLSRVNFTFLLRTKQQAKSSTMQVRI